MLTLEDPADLAGHVGQKLGTSDWLLVDQKMIDAFAEATGDRNWFHVDPERAKDEMPGGRTIAHGYLTLSLIPRLTASIYKIKNWKRALNYGANRVRFTAPVPVNSRVRLTQTLKQAEPVEGGMRLTFEAVIEVEGSARPAMVAETIVMAVTD